MPWLNKNIMRNTLGGTTVPNVKASIPKMPSASVPNVSSGASIGNNLTNKQVGFGLVKDIFSAGLKFYNLSEQEDNLKEAYSSSRDQFGDQQSQTVRARDDTIGGFQGKKSRGLSYSGFGTDKAITDYVYNDYQSTIERQNQQWDDVRKKYHDKINSIRTSQALLPLGTFLSGIFGVDILDKLRGIDDSKDSNILPKSLINYNSSDNDRLDINKSQAQQQLDDDNSDRLAKKKVINEG